MNFFMVIMASGIARGRVRTTTTTEESRKMAAILQVIGWQRHAALIYRLLLWYWTSMLWSTDTCQNKVSADQYHVTISRAQVCSSSKSRVFLKSTADQLLVFDWIAGSCHVNLLKTGQEAYGHFVCACARWMEYLSSAPFVWTRTRCVGFLNGWSALRERSCQERWKIISSLHTFLTLWICTLFVGTLDEDILMIKVRT